MSAATQAKLVRSARRRVMGAGLEQLPLALEWASSPPSRRHSPWRQTAARRCAARCIRNRLRRARCYSELAGSSLNALAVSDCDAHVAPLLAALRVANAPVCCIATVDELTGGLQVLLGDMGAGKSSLVLRFVKGQFFDFQASHSRAAAFDADSGAGVGVDHWGRLLDADRLRQRCHRKV